MHYVKEKAEIIGFYHHECLYGMFSPSENSLLKLKKIPTVLTTFSGQYSRSSFYSELLIHRKEYYKSSGLLNEFST
ncbi:hypothetical protein IRB23SM22_04920 [Alkalibacterium sp. s-m-22]